MPPDKKFKTTIVNKIAIPDTEDDAADFNERDIAEKGTDCTRDTQYRGADGACPPPLFMGRGTAHYKRCTSANRTTAMPNTPPLKRIMMKTANGVDNTESSAPTAGLTSRMDRTRGFAECEDENTFQTAIETIVSKVPATVRSSNLRAFEAPIKEEDEGLFVTATCDEETSTIPTQPHQVPKVAPRVPQGIRKVARIQLEKGSAKVMPESARQPMVPVLRTKKLGK